MVVQGSRFSLYTEVYFGFPLCIFVELAAEKPVSRYNKMRLCTGYI
jgi:hypothetical protein